VLSIYQFAEFEAEQSGAASAAPPEKPEIHNSPSVPRKHESGVAAPLPESRAEAALLGTDGRDAEPVTVLINELYSPDPETRSTAAMRLSQRSVHASEALPVLKKLAQEEPDPKVRAVMNEAILNIRGLVPSPFEPRSLK
jgi:hypothetical protein